MIEIQPRLRPYQPDDLGSIYKIAVASAQHDGVDPNSTLESVPTKAEFQALFESSNTSYLDVLVAADETTGEILGYGLIRWWQEDNGTFVYAHKGNVHPIHRQKGIGATLLAGLQERIQAIAATHPSDALKVYGANTSSTEKGTDELLEMSGYEKAWSMVEMEFTDLNSLEKLAPPEGFELHPVISEEDKRAVYTANKEIYKGQFGISPTDEEDYQEFLADTPDASLWKVLWHGDDLAGFVLSKTDEDSAEIIEVSVIPDFRRRGLGKYLMIEGMLELKDRGVNAIRLHTDATGQWGGRQLYEHIGFSSLKEHYRYRKKFK